MNEEEAIERIKLHKDCAQIPNGCCIVNAKDLETVLNLSEKQKAEIEKKDKIIDELEDIFYNYQLCEYELTDCTYRKCEYIADDEIPPCKEYIKQYFKEKVEKEQKNESI